MSDSTTYLLAIATRIQEVLSDRPTAYPELLRQCRGAFPTVVDACIEQLRPKLKPSTIMGFELDDDRGDVGTWSAVETLESNPVLSAWYFTPDTCRRIAGLRDWGNMRLAFLGAPRLYEWFCAHRLGRVRVLFELDSRILRALALEMQSGENNRMITYDAAEPIPADLKGEFDCVFFDPPWYVYNYRLWLSRATMLIDRGIIIFPLFPELTRPVAERERHEIKQECEDVAVNVWMLSQFVDYLVPTFERYELASHGTRFPGTWKVADLMLIQRDPGRVVSPPAGTDCTACDWKEVDIGTLRVFIRGNSVVDDPRLLFLPAEWGWILPSPSLRDPQRRSANVLTSRGHALCTGEPARLEQILELVAERIHNGVPPEAVLREAIDDAATRAILERMLSNHVEFCSPPIPRFDARRQHD